MRAPLRRLSVLAGLVCLLAVLSGCITAEVKSAGAALDAARSAGKDRECPSDFAAAEDLVRRAELLCNQCKPSEANALAAEAMGRINALCPKAAAAPAPAPEPVRTPPPAAAPTVSLSAVPNSIDEGKCTTLTWTATNATSVSIDPGVGSVSPSGSKEVCPSSTTRYTITVNGPGGTRSDSTNVGVTPKKATDKLTIHVNFDFNKSNIRKADEAELRNAEAFVKKHGTCKIEIDGYTDSKGTEAYNLKLSERRAAAVKNWLIDHGAPSGDAILTVGHGESNPVASNDTDEGRAQNRRAEILAFCQ